MARRSEPKLVTDRIRPDFPQRAVVTAGMPYGNKDLHFGHVGGVFAHADAFARFLRDRIGRDSVIFVSGTDCYGSPIVEDHRKQVAEGRFRGSLLEFAERNHRIQRQTLAAYAVEPDRYAASALEPWVSLHRDFGAWVMRTLHAHRHLEQRSTLQFYDGRAGAFLTGRQVVGRCPIAGCGSEKAYAEECALGHQYEPKELLDPRSSLSGTRPEMREVRNWYVPVEEFRGELEGWYGRLLESGEWREFAVRHLLEYFEPPTIHVKREHLDALEDAAAGLPPFRREPGRGKSDRLLFDSLADMEKAVGVLAENGIRYRTGKVLAPFRLTGNLEWGLPAPDLDDLTGLTFWVWPESLWAPISFSAELLRSRGGSAGDWRAWWCSTDARVYQFIGEDNIYYYGLAEMAMFLGLQGTSFAVDAPDGVLQLPRIIANRHLLFLDRKASSSGKVKPPMARELLEHYTADQLRIHFLSLALGARNASFRPKPYDPRAGEGAPDPVMKDGNLLSNALNRAVRSCFYTAQKYFDRRLPPGEVGEDVVRACETAILDFEAAMARHEFHVAIDAAGDLVRGINSRWTRDNPYHEGCDPDRRAQALIDGFHGVRVAVALLHPVAPAGTETVARYLAVGDELWSWERIFEPLSALIAEREDHRFAEVPPRFDFFEKHPSQVRSDG